MLNQRTRQANALIETLASSRGALRETKSSVGALARQRRQLAGDYARAETARRKLAAQRDGARLGRLGVERLQPGSRRDRHPGAARQAEGRCSRLRVRSSRSAARRRHDSGRCWSGPGDPRRRAGAHALRDAPPHGLRHRRHRRGPDRRAPGLGAVTGRGVHRGRGAGAARSHALPPSRSAGCAEGGPPGRRPIVRRRLQGPRLRARRAYAGRPSGRGARRWLGACLDGEPALDRGRRRERLPRRRARRRPRRPHPPAEAAAGAERCRGRLGGRRHGARRQAPDAARRASSTASRGRRTAPGRRCCG